MKLRCKDRFLSLDRVAVMGVLNVTPDSFSDGGLWLEAAAAVEHGVEMVEAGAAIVDVGGESTRPGADPIDGAEELRRTIPVIEQLAGRVEVPISIDTRKPDVAERALEAGASIINDTQGEGGDDRMMEVALDSGAAFVAMHSRGTPATMRTLTHYGDVVADVKDWLAQRAVALEREGLARDAIVLDPGFGFAKTPDQNLQLLNELDSITALGYPILAGTSRKSFIGAVLDLPEGARMGGTAATVAWAVWKGARIVRVHDVVEMVRTVRMTEAILATRVDD